MFSTQEDCMSGIPSGVLDAWGDHALPLSYAVWRRNEALLLTRLLGGYGASLPRVADVGCGPCRILTDIGQLVSAFTGFDRDAASLSAAQTQFGRDTRFSFVGPAAYEAHFDGPGTRDNPFDLVICLGNTLGILAGDPKLHVERMARASRAIFLSIIGRGVLPLREDYYRQNGIAFEVDPVTETIRSDMWGESRAWDIEGCMELASGLGTMGFRDVSIIPVLPMGYALHAARID